MAIISTIIIFVAVSVNISLRNAKNELLSRNEYLALFKEEANNTIAEEGK